MSIKGQSFNAPWATGARIDFGVGTGGLASVFNGAFTIAVLAKMTSPNWGLLGAYSDLTATSVVRQFFVANNAGARMFGDGDFSSGWPLNPPDTDGINDDVWRWHVVSKAAGAAHYKMSYADLATLTWADGEGTGAANHGDVATPAQMFSSWAIYPLGFDAGDQAVVAVWGQAMTPAQIHASCTAAASNLYTVASPKGGWLFKQSVAGSAIADFTGGGANEISRQFLATSADPPGFNFSLGPTVADLPVATETDTASTFTTTIVGTLPAAVTTSTASGLAGLFTSALPTAVELDTAMPLFGGGGVVAVQTGPCTWDIDTTCCGSWGTFTAPVQTFATAFAKKILWALSGRRYGACQLDLRPCKKSTCSGMPAGGWWSAGPMWVPMINPQGVWVNSCGCFGETGDCSCNVEQTVVLPGPVSSILSVMVDGVTVPSTAYTVYDYGKLVRTDGGKWPVCQNFEAAVTSPGSFLVSYMRGIAVPFELQCLSGILACEIGKLCVGDKTCRLPRSVASVARQGVNVDFVPLDTILKLKLTGIPEIDMWLTADNPDRLAGDTVVWSPDVHRGRQKTS